MKAESSIPSTALLDSIRRDAEFITETCDGECYCDMAKIADGGEPCAVCQCIAAAKNILACLSNAPRQDRSEATYPERGCSQIGGNE